MDRRPCPCRLSRLPRAMVAIALLVLVGLFASHLRVSAAPEADVPYQVVGPGVEAFPGNGQTLLPLASSLHVRLSGHAAIDTGRPMQVFVDGHDVTAQCSRRDTTFRIPVPGDLAAGEHRVRLVLPTLVKSGQAVEWTFIAPEPAARDAKGPVAVTHNAKRTLYEGDSLEITAEGPPGGKAMTQAGPIEMPMQEVSPGVYRAQRDVQRSDYCMGKPVKVFIVLPQGRVVAGVSEAPARMFGQMFTIRILAPKPDEPMGWDFVIKGRTRPNARVTITPTIGGGRAAHPDMQANTPPVGSIARGTGSLETQADGRGYFEQKFGFPIHVPLSYSFVVTATDEKGEKAIPTSFVVRMGSKKPAGTPTPAPSSTPSKK